MPAFVALAPKDAAAQDTQPAVQGHQPALPFRADTMLGVCEGIGQDLGFNPTYLRVVFASLFYFDPAIVVGSYLALGAGLALARWLYPVRAAPVAEAVTDSAAPTADNEDSERSLAA
jgi:phage shock protein PspC (stress-responsive transcriptional regulator)